MSIVILIDNESGRARHIECENDRRGAPLCPTDFRRIRSDPTRAPKADSPPQPPSHPKGGRTGSYLDPSAPE
eukprot:713374-Pyramimonas_sp.AAC.1